MYIGILIAILQLVKITAMCNTIKKVSYAYVCMYIVKLLKVGNLKPIIT